MVQQKRLPGTEDAKIEEIHEAAEPYVKARDKRIKATASEVNEKANLLAVMNKHKIKSYRYNDLEIEIVPEGEKLTVKMAKAADDE